jgi:SAM-dependent methyltransferase
MLSWMSDDRFSVDQTTFQAIAEDYFEGGGGLELDENDFFVFKFRPEIDDYVELFRSLAPERIFELGVHRGGSTVLFAELARPRKLVAIDLEPLPQVRERIERHAAAIGLGDAVKVFAGVDQSDRKELARIAEAEFDGPLDLVVDDCSHLYGPTRQSFNELFPRLREGGVYVIEDWRWWHLPRGQEAAAEWAPEIPLSRLIVEIVLASATLPGLAAETTIDLNGVSITRGDAPLSPGAFDVSGLVSKDPSDLRSNTC